MRVVSIEYFTEPFQSSIWTCQVLDLALCSSAPAFVGVASSSLTSTVDFQRLFVGHESPPFLEESAR